MHSRRCAAAWQGRFYVCGAVYPPPHCGASQERPFLQHRENNRRLQRPLSDESSRRTPTCSIAAGKLSPRRSGRVKGVGAPKAYTKTRAMPAAAKQMATTVFKRGDDRLGLVAVWLR